VLAIAASLNRQRLSGQGTLALHLPDWKL
jgi:hypothetical protein